VLNWLKLHSDKVAHFAVGYTIFSVAAAVGKELWDATINPVTGKQRGNPDMLDAAATILGGAVAALILF